MAWTASGLLAVPRAPVGRPESGDHFSELVEPVSHCSPCRRRRYYLEPVVIVELDFEPLTCKSLTST